MLKSDKMYNFKTKQGNFELDGSNISQESWARAMFTTVSINIWQLSRPAAGLLSFYCLI